MSGDTVTIDLVVPRLGETMEEGVLVEWLVAVGDAFGRGAPVLEIETDKTVAEMPALVAGRLVERLAEVGETVAVGSAVGRIEIAAADAPSRAPSNAPAGASDDGSEATSEGAPDAKGAEADGGTRDDSPEGVPANDGAPVRATPAARRLARRHGLDVRDVTGTGRRGRVETADVEAATPGGRAVGSSAAVARPSTSAAAFAPAPDGAFPHDLTGPADGAPWLLLHGFAADRTAWATLAHGLARAGRRTLVPDLPGHGESRADARCADDLSVGLGAFVRDALGEAPAHVVAHSLGAAPALALADAVPLASLTLIAPAGTGSTIDAEFVRAMAAPASVGELAHLLRRLCARPNGLSAAAIEALRERLARGRLRTLADSLLGVSGQALDLVPAIDRTAARLPVRVLVGHADRIVDWRDACALSPRVAVHHFPDAGHMPHWDAPREVLALLTEGI